MKSYSRAYEKLLGAMELMSTGKGMRPERLELVTLSYIIHLRTDDVPNELAGELQAFMAGMCKTKDPHRGKSYAMGDIWWTARHMHWKTAEKLSKQLFNMYLVVSEYRNKARCLKGGFDA